MSSYCNYQFNMLNSKVQLITFNNTFLSYSFWNFVNGVGLQLRDGIKTCNKQQWFWNILATMS